jgi:hypothetical protein
MNSKWRYLERYTCVEIALCPPANFMVRLRLCDAKAPCQARIKAACDWLILEWLIDRRRESCSDSLLSARIPLALEIMRKAVADAEVMGGIR